MVIRHALVGDASDMVAIYGPYVLETSYTFEYEVPSVAEFARRLLNHESQCPWLVCEERGRILGYAYAEKPFSRTAYSWTVELSIYLSPRAQGKGIGAALYAVLERMVTAQGYCRALAVVADENESSRRFHQRLGYQQGAVMTSCGYKLGQWHSLDWMEKCLRTAEDPGPLPTAASEMDWRSVDVSDLKAAGWMILI